MSDRIREYLLRWRVQRLSAIPAHEQVSGDGAIRFLRSGFLRVATDCSLHSSDCRAGKVLFVPHCMLNQNARVAGAAEMPALAKDLISGLMAREIGIMQLPCPELLFFGLDRAQVPIREVLASPVGKAACQQLVEEVAGQIREFSACGIRVLGILGKNGSPTCGVETTWDDGVVPGSGVFMEVLQTTLQRDGSAVELAGVIESQPKIALDTVDRWMK